MDHKEVPTLSVRVLIVRAARAIMFPRDSFASIGPARIPYGRAMVVAALCGVFWIHLHSYLLFTDPIWITWQRWVLYSVVFAFFPLSSWLLHSLIAWHIHRFFGGTRTREEFDQAVWYLLWIWIFLPIFDLPHLWVSTRLVTLPIFGTHPLHISHIVAFPLIAIELYYFLLAFFPKQRILLVFGAFAGLPFVKFIAEDVPFLFEEAFFRLGITSGKYDDAVVGFVVGVPFWCFGFLWWSAGTWLSRRVRITWFAGLVAFFLILGGLTLPTIEPLYPDYTSDSGQVDARYESTLVSRDFLLRDAIQFQNDQERPQSFLRCIVHLTYTTAVQNKERTRLRCDIVDESGVLLEGASQGNLGPQKDIITTWDTPSLLSRLATHNDIRIHIDAAPGDRVHFNGVWVELER